MLQSLLDRLTLWDTRQMIGVTVMLQNDGTRAFTGVVVSKGKEFPQIKQQRQFKHLKDLAEWINQDHEKLPVVLGVDGRSVLTRRVDELPGEQSIEALIKSVVSTGNVADFVVNVYQREESFYTAIARRELLEALLDDLKDNEISPVALFIGVPAYMNLAFEVMEGNHVNSSFGIYSIQSRKDQKVNISRAVDQAAELVPIAGGVPGEYLPGYGYVQRFMLGKHTDFLTANYGELGPKILDYPQKVLYKYLVMFSLGFLLVSLLVNAFLFINFNSTNEVLSERSSDTQLLLDSYERKQKEYAEKKKLIDQLNYSSANLAYLSDQVAGCVKGNLALTKLAIHPVSANKRKKHTPFDLGVLLVEGESKTSEAFGTFITSIQQLDFVDEIMYQNYAYNARERVGNFEVKIQLKE